MPRLSTKFNPLLKSYPESEKINSVSEGAEVLYVRLLAASDDAHRYWGDAGWVLSKLFTARMLAGNLTKEDVEKRLLELENCQPEPLIKRYYVGKERYLELINCQKSLRSDVELKILFPPEFTESGTTRNEVVPPTSTSTQPNQDVNVNDNVNRDEDLRHEGADEAGKLNSHSGSRCPALDKATQIDWQSFDWESIWPECRKLNHQLPAKCKPLKDEDREVLAKIVALWKIGVLADAWIDVAMAKARRRSTKRPFGALQGILRDKCFDCYSVYLNRFLVAITYVPPRQTVDSS